MKKGQIKNIELVWALIQNGTTVYCSNKSYKVYVEENIGCADHVNSAARQYSTKNGNLLSVRCIANYFGSIIRENDLSELFTE